MKTTCLCLLMVLLPITSAMAEDAGAPVEPTPLTRVNLGAYFSYWDIDTLDDFDVSGFVGGGIVGQFQFNPYLVAEARLSGFLAGDTQDVFVPGQGWIENELTLSALPLEIGLLGNLPIGDTFSIYGGPGVGFYFFDGEYTTTQGPVEITRDINLDDESGFYVVLGGRARLARNFQLFAEAKYTWVESTIKESVGVFELDHNLDLDGLALNAGAMFTF